LNGKGVGRTEFGKTQRKVGLLCAVLKVMSYISEAFSMPLQLSYCVM